MEIKGLNESEVIVRWIKIKDDIFDYPKESFKKIIDERRYSKLIKYKNIEDFYLGALGYLIINSEINKLYKYKLEKLNWSYDENNKPFILNYPKIEINISHSNKVVIGCICNSKVGVDVEKIRDIQVHEMLEMLCSKKEKNNLKNMNYKNKLSFFYDIWTIKESYSKAVGKGLLIPFSNIEIDDLNKKIVSNTCEEIYYYKKIEDIKGYKAAITTTKSELKIEVKELCLKEFLKECFKKI